MEKQEEPKRKLSMREKLRTRILRGDPRSASDGVDRTPIALSKQSGSELSSTTIEMNTPENKLKTLSLVDPRSPGEIDRTPIQIEEQPVRRRVLAGDECETPVRSAVHHSLVNKLELDARTQLIIDDGSRDESGIDGLSPIVAVKPPIDVINIHSALNDTPKTLEFSGLDTNPDAGKPAVQMRAGGARGQPHKILQERLRSVVQSQLISDAPQTAPAAGDIVLDESNMSVTSSNDTSLVI